MKKKSEHSGMQKNAGTGLTGRSISKNLAISLSLIVFLVMTAILLFIYCMRSQDLLKMAEKKADEHIARLVNILALPMWNLDQKSIAGISTEFAHNDMVEEVVITDVSGSVLLMHGSRGPDHMKIRRKGDIFWRNVKLGNAEISLSLRKYKEDLHFFFLIGVVILMGSVLIIFVATGWLLRVYLRNPLAELCTGMDQVARGVFPQHDVYDTYMELAGIAERFRQMAKKVEDRENAFASANQMLRDEISDRKRAEEALRESEAKFKNLFDVCPLSIILTEPETGRVADVNQEFYAMTKLSREQAIGRTTIELGFFTEQQRRNFVLAFRETGEIRNREEDIGLGDGSVAHTLISAKIVRMAGKDMILSIITDITEHKKSLREKEELQEKLARSKKMEALGLLAGGVAHDLNNILSGVVSYPDLLLMDIPKESRLRGPIETIKEAGQRAAAVVSDLLTLARGVASTHTVTNLNCIVREYLDSPEYSFLCGGNPDIHLETRLNADLLDIRCSPLHIRKILMNLVINAFEAIEEKGTILIFTRNQYVDRPIRGYDDIRIGEYAVLSVSDSGCGIAPDNLERIFEPFYTRKVMGRNGTGLGLTIVWNTVQEHKGYIDVESGAGGTRFDLYFPVARPDSRDEKKESLSDEYSGKGEKILVVDDEKNQRTIACGILSKLGYAPEAVESGEKALEYLRSHTADLLILDMIMPSGMSGRKTYEEIIKICPGQKAVIASGFAETSDVKEIQALGAGLYVKKPYTLESIGIAVRTELDK
ncbi:MAG: ATP-binding protein [Desulfobacterales bacterium]